MVAPEVARIPPQPAAIGILCSGAHAEGPQARSSRVRAIAAFDLTRSASTASCRRPSGVSR